MHPVLSHFQAKELLAARRSGKITAEVSSDLGMTPQTVRLDLDEVRFSTGETLGWEAVAEVAGDENGCYTVRDGAVH